MVRERPKSFQRIFVYREREYGRATIVFAFVKFIWFICAHANTHNILFVPHFGRYFRYSFNINALTQDTEEKLKRGASCCSMAVLFPH